ncbi:MAG: hypothetical protein II655_04605, partial [Thermoguttaceae bacterium]|nr:hypothetical protein [Thermoguttaceae bacterium]
MKKALIFSLLVILSSVAFIGCKSGTNCFTRNGSRVPILGGSSASAIDDSAIASTPVGPRVVNAYPTNEVVMMNAASAYGQCEPCAPSQCNPCDPCSPSTSGRSASGYPTQ